jgi:hypothetical protein
MVVSWAEEKSNPLDLLLHARSGFTQNLLQHCKKQRRSSLPCMALYTGPHGISAPVDDYETVLLVASGIGVVAHLPYLEQLLHGYRTCKSRTRRVHLVWQSEVFGKLLSSCNLGDPLLTVNRWQFCSRTAVLEPLSNRGY